MSLTKCRGCNQDARQTRELEWTGIDWICPNCKLNGK